jgi:hypothetical protein
MEEGPNTFIIILAGILAVGLAIIHLFSGKLRLLNVFPRSRWLSAASGVSVAYVFVDILPELAEQQETIREALGEGLVFLERHVYLLSLLGLAIFYGLDRAAKASRRRKRDAGKGDATDAGVFWLHMASFSVYNVLIGYLLLHRENPGLKGLLLYAGALGLHFVVNDYGLREDHKESYRRIGRFILAAAILLGWAIGVLVAVPAAFLAVLFAFLAGGIVLNVLKEEIPGERQSSFLAFALGAAFYAALLLVAL